MQIVSMETICMKCQILFSGKNKKKHHSMWLAEFAQIVVKVNISHLKYVVASQTTVEPQELELWLIRTHFWVPTKFIR